MGDAGRADDDADEDAGGEPDGEAGREVAERVGEVLPKLASHDPPVGSSRDLGVEELGHRHRSRDPRRDQGHQLPHGDESHDRGQLGAGGAGEERPQSS